jgi:hypothetical protein
MNAKQVRNENYPCQPHDDIKDIQDLLIDSEITDDDLDSLSAVEKPGQSQLWNGLMNIKDISYNYCRKKLGDGKGTRFWKDKWVRNTPFANKFPRLYDISSLHNITVHSVIAGGMGVLQFRTNLWGGIFRDVYCIKQGS